MTGTTARIVGLDTAGIRTLRAQADGTTGRLPHVVPVAPDLGVILADDDGSILTAPALAEMGWTDEDVLRAAVAAAQEQAGGDVAVIQPGTIVIQDPPSPCCSCWRRCECRHRDCARRLHRSRE